MIFKSIFLTQKIARVTTLKIKKNVYWFLVINLVWSFEESTRIYIL